MPEITVFNRQRRAKFDLARLRKEARAAVRECLQHPHQNGAELEGLGMVEVNVVSDATISRVHKRYCGVGGPTDVITFPYGELLLSGETAVTNAASHRVAVDEEMLRYIIHGLLHLQGWRDDTAPHRREMHRIQEQIIITIQGNHFYDENV